MSGFSIVELIVSISILVLVLSIVLTQQSSFNSAVLLRSQAYEIALAMREVQLGAVSASNDASGNFRTVLGVHFDEDRPDRYVVFRDLNNNNFYDEGETPAEEYGLLGRLDSRFEIAELDLGTNASDDVSVVFERPNFDAMFFVDAAGTRTNQAVISIRVGLRGDTDDICGQSYRDIEITAAGQIAVLECP